MSRTWSYGLHAVAGAGVPVPEVMMGKAGRQGLCSSACVCGTRSAVRLGIWNERRTNHVACHHRWKQNRRLRLLLRRRRLQHLCPGCLILRLRLRRGPNPKPTLNQSFQIPIPGCLGLGMSQASEKPEPALPQLASDVVMSDPGLDLGDENVREAVYGLRL